MKVGLDPIKKDLKEQCAILDTHTKALDQLLTRKKTKDDENTVSAARFDRLEHWAKQVGEKIGVKLEL